MERRNFLKGGLAAAFMAGCNAGSPMSPEPIPIPYAPDYDALAGAGDIGCSPGAILTSELLKELKTREPYTRVFTLGDNTQIEGTPEEYACFDRTWGPLVDYPVVGNHDSKHFFTYFAGKDVANGYYSRAMKYWHLVFLNSEIDIGKNSMQLAWLDYDLRNRSKKWIAAFAHRPRFSSCIQNGDTKYMSHAWDVLHLHGAKASFGGHDHDVEVFEKMNSDGEYYQRGMMSFVFGTGGADQTGYISVKSPRPTSLIRNSGTMGVANLYFKENSLDWKFIPIPGKDFTASGTLLC
jgi:hypothetical protein